MMPLTGIVARARSLWRGLRRRGDVEREMAEEFRLHQELRAADLVRGGMTPAEAGRQARLEFGVAERYKDEAREARGLRRFDDIRVSWLDVKLGGRMLARYPGLTVVGGFALAFAIWVSVVTFEFVSQVVDPRLPVAESERLVGLQNWDAAAGKVDRQALHDFVAWRGALRSVESLGAFRAFQRNLITADGNTLPVDVAEISASAFRVTGVPPLLGRGLVAADELPGAPPVAVIGHDVWQSRFGGDPAIVGRTVRIGRVAHTVVGVMPAGYGFPIAQSLWVPLGVDAAGYERGQGPAVQMFGRLAPGVTLAEAQAELTTLGRRATADAPGSKQQLRPQIMPYAHSILNLTGTKAVAIWSINVFLVMLLVLVCSNVALLMFARAATREGEIVVRSALGASRGRIVTQLFAEALVLGGLASALGLATAGVALRWWLGVFAADLERPLPFWFSARLSPGTVVYAVVLTVLGAVIAGVVPALKVTRGLQARLRQVAAGGGGLRFGGIWTAVIITQVAVTVAFPVTAFVARREAVQVQSIVADFRAAEFLSVRLDMDREPPIGARQDTSRTAYAARFRASYEELARRLTAEPGVVGVTLADRLPRTFHPHRLVQVDASTGSGQAGGAAPLDPDHPAYYVSAASVDPAYFDVLGTPIRAGRAFQTGDLVAAAGVSGSETDGGGPVIVNQSFVDQVLGGRNPIGRRVRYQSIDESDQARTAGPKPGPWHEIVGVVADLGMAEDEPKAAGMYHPLAPGTASPVQMAVHVSGRPGAFSPRLRTVAAAVDPTLRLDRLLPMDELSDAQLRFIDFWLRLTIGVSAVAVVLSLTGIYAVLSFTVARRTREIGIRVSLGSNQRRVVAAVFRRPLTQVGLGVLAGGVLVGLLLVVAEGGGVSLSGVALLVAYTAGMLGVCLLACIVPTRRALRVQPTIALRADG